MSTQQISQAIPLLTEPLVRAGHYPTAEQALKHNAPHHPEQATNFPHYFHDVQGRLVHSPLSGNPLAGLALILRQTEDYLRQSGQA
jgi:hypothetical protein